MLKQLSVIYSLWMCGKTSRQVSEATQFKSGEGKQLPVFVLAVRAQLTDPSLQLFNSSASQTLFRDDKPTVRLNVECTIPQTTESVSSEPRRRSSGIKNPIAS